MKPPRGYLLPLQMPPAAFRRLCVETKTITRLPSIKIQPPSGGCVLKLIDEVAERVDIDPAAFRRLCVET